MNAYRKFLLNWKPEEQTENQELLRLQKDYAKSGYVFCLTGRPGHYLQDERVFAQKWNMYYEKQKMLILHNVQFLVKKNRLRESTVRSKGYMEDLQQEVC